MRVPTRIDKRFGIGIYELDDYQFLHPGDLIDAMVENTDVCRSGAFVVRALLLT
jgi:hypothetical protein